MHLSKDISSIITVLQTDWFTRWGKYLNKKIDAIERKKLQELTCSLIKNKFSNRNMLKNECLRLKMDKKLIDIAFSSWGGILKDLNYMGEITYKDYDNSDFIINENQIKKGNKEKHLQNLMKRYFTCYGPATLNDFCYWCGKTKSTIKPSFENIQQEFEQVKDTKGITYFYYRKLQEGDYNNIPHFIFLKGFDPILLAYKDKSRLIDESKLKHVFLRNGYIHNVLLMDGSIIGIWKKTKNILEISSFYDLTKTNKIEIEYSARKNDLLNFREIVFK